MLNYQDAKKRIFARAKVPDGYSGHMAEVGISLIDGKVCYVAKNGAFWSGLTVTDERESIWMLNNHPSSNAYDIRRTA
jgi:hypothetical protein